MIMPENKVFSSPQAYITIDGKPAGYIQNLSFTENIQRASVKGLGSLTDQQVPAVGMNCQFTVGQFFLSFNQPATKALLNRMGGLQPLLDTLSLGEFPFDIVVYTKTVTGTDANNKLVTSTDKTGETIAKLSNCYTDNQSFNLSESGIAASNVSGRYLTPVTFKP